MYHKWAFISFIFFSFLSTNILAQVIVPYAFDCEKSIEFLQKNCYYCGERYVSGRCFVEKFSYLGEAKDKQYFYGVYKLDDRTFPQLKIYKLHWQWFFVIYEGEKNKSKLKPIHFLKPRYELDNYNCEMAETKFGSIIHVQIVRDASGWDEGEYIIENQGKWEKLREPSWLCASEGLLPQNYSLAYDKVKIDLKTMSIKFPVRKDTDEYWSPTGGDIIFKLIIDKDRFRIINSKFLRSSLNKDKESKTNTSSFSYGWKSIDFLKHNCYPGEENFIEEECRIKEFKHLGNHNDKQFYYGLYSKKSDDSSYYDSHFIIYEGKRNSKFLKPVEFFYPDEFIEYYDVEMTNTKYGLIIHIYMSNGNAGFDMGEYIIYKNGKWEKLKVPDWYCVYEWVIPEDTYFCRGNTLDLKSMTNTFSVYSDNDACCCPTKGVVKSKLTIDDGGFRIISSKYYPDLEE